MSHFGGLYRIESGVPLGSVFGSILYLLSTTDLPTPLNATAGSVLLLLTDPAIASQNLQASLNMIQSGLIKWRQIRLDLLRL